MAGNIVVGILRALLTADAAEYVDGLRQSLSDTEAFGKAMKTVGKDLSAIGSAVMPLSLAVGAIGVASAKAAIDFESSFAGIRKTVADATDSMGNLTSVGQAIAQGMRDMAKEIPVNVNELNKVGEAAGQLGIKSENILGFTRVMADLGVTTNLSSDQAATALARLANITQMPQADFDRLGSTIVALGNNMATTEAEITEFGLRIAGAGTQVGLSEAQILAIGAALSSVGINAEAGGTAISKVMIDMAASVEAGGDRLEAFAAVAGVSSAAFKQQFETDAAGALVAFITGLGNMEGSGKTALGVLADMEITETRMRDALLRASGAGDLLANSIAIGTQAWGDNNALTKEAEQRYQTFESQLTILWNQFKDIAITVGTAMLPVMTELLEVFRSWIPYIEAAAKWFTDLSPEMQKTVVIIGGLVAALGPALVALGTLVTTIGAAVPVITAVGTAFVTFISGPIGWITAAIVGLTLVWQIWGDDITKIVTDTWATISEFFVGKFNAIVDHVKQKIEAVKGFFKGMYDAVVGGSYVPDMIQGISQQFALLEPYMVQKTKSAADLTVAQFSGMASKVNTYMGMFATAVEVQSQAASQHMDLAATRIDASLLMIANEVTATSVTIEREVTKQVSLFGSFSDGIVGELGRLWEHMSGGQGFAGLMENLGSSIVQGFGSILSGGLTSVINMGVSMAIEGVKKIGSLIGGLFQSEESKHVNQPRDAFWGQYGGYEGASLQLTKRLEEMGDSDPGGTADNLIRAVFDARTEDAFRRAEEAIASIIGGNVFATGTPGLGAMDFGAGELALLHGREAVIPESRMGEFAAAHGPDQTINIYLDSVLVTQRVVRNMPRVLALHGVG